MQARQAGRGRVLSVNSGAIMALYWCLLHAALAAHTAAQTCQGYGRQCFDHSECCGGCCRNNVCVDSTRLCSAMIEDCGMFYCPPGFSCSLYQAAGCPGCAIVPYCRPDDNQFWALLAKEQPPHQA